MSSGTAAPMQPKCAAWCSVVDLPDGAGTAQSAHRGHRRHAPTGREGAPVVVLVAHVGARSPFVVLVVYVGVRVDECSDDRGIVLDRRPHQRGPITPVHGGASEGANPERGTLARGTHNTQPSPGGDWGPGGAEPHGVSLKNSGVADLKRISTSLHILSIPGARRWCRQAECNKGDRE